MTLDCVKNVSSLRERNSSQGSFLFIWATPEADASRVFLFLLYDAVNQLAGFSEILHHFTEILLHVGSVSFRFIWQTRPSAWAVMGFPDYFTTQYSSSQVSEKFFMTSLKYFFIWVRSPFMHLADAALCLGYNFWRALFFLADVIGVADAGLCQLLFEIVLHVEKLLSSHEPRVGFPLGFCRPPSGSDHSNWRCSGTGSMGWMIQAVFE